MCVWCSIFFRTGGSVLHRKFLPKKRIFLILNVVWTASMSSDLWQYTSSTGLVSSGVNPTSAVSSGNLIISESEKGKRKQYFQNIQKMNLQMNEPSVSWIDNNDLFVSIFPKRLIRAANPFHGLWLSLLQKLNCNHCRIILLII